MIWYIACWPDTQSLCYRAMRSRPAINGRADGRASFLRAPDTVAPPVALEPDNSPYRSPRCPGSRRASAGPLCPPRAPPPPALLGHLAKLDHDLGENVLAEGAVWHRRPDRLRFHR